ncbi:MAG TPA: YdeI/OmpD-associated family protein [Chthoniobacterales bacterium]|nr:YdeI/OmpD-associated family protein [Chthoniobacterales bacterium]
MAEQTKPFAVATKDSRIDAYIAKSADFARPILKHLRKVIHAGCPQVVETVKWSMPHFDHKGVMCGIAAFKEHCAFGFWKADLIFDRDKQPEKNGMGSFGCIKSLKDLPNEKTLIGYVKKAAQLNEAGIKAPGRTPPKKREPLPTPDYFSAALKKNAKANKTFESLSPSHRREYLDWVTEAKREETQKARLATSIKWLAEGKRRNWKYMPAKK